MNVCLGKQFSGGELYFRGIRCENHVNSETQHEVYCLVDTYNKLQKKLSWWGKTASRYFNKNRVNCLTPSQNRAVYILGSTPPLGDTNEPLSGMFLWQRLGVVALWNSMALGSPQQGTYGDRHKSNGFAKASHGCREA